MALKTVYGPHWSRGDLNSKPGLRGDGKKAEILVCAESNRLPEPEKRKKVMKAMEEFRRFLDEVTMWGIVTHGGGGGGGGKKPEYSRSFPRTSLGQRISIKKGRRVRCH